jgi:hypothetical protein
VKNKGTRKIREIEAASEAEALTLAVEGGLAKSLDKLVIVEN